MPDLLSHALTGHAIQRASGGRLDYTLVLAASMLPDVVSWLPMNVYLKAEGWSGYWLPAELERYFPPMHSPLLVLLWCVLLSLAFVPRLRSVAWWSLLSGSTAHVLLDLLQLKYDGGYLVFYPASLDRFQIGLVPQASWVVWIAVTGVAALACEGVHRWRCRT